MLDWLYTIKNKHVRLLLAFVLLIVVTTWLWLGLRPLGYSYMQVLFGWLVISLAADRVRIVWQDLQKKRVYKAHTQ